MASNIHIVIIRDRRKYAIKFTVTINFIYPTKHAIPITFLLHSVIIFAQYVGKNILC